MSGSTVLAPATSTIESDAGMITQHNSYSLMLDDPVRRSPVRPRSSLSVPPPAKFVRKHSTVQPSQRQQEQSANFPNSNVKDYEENIIAARVSANQRNSFGSYSIESEYYIAHRQYVAEEIARSDIMSFSHYDDTDDVIWDGLIMPLMRVVSV